MLANPTICHVVSNDLISPHRYTFMRIATHAFRAFAGIFPQKDKQSLTFEGC